MHSLHRATRMDSENNSFGNLTEGTAIDIEKIEEGKVLIEIVDGVMLSCNELRSGDEESRSMILSWNVHGDSIDHPVSDFNWYNNDHKSRVLAGEVEHKLPFKKSKISEWISDVRVVLQKIDNNDTAFKQKLSSRYKSIYADLISVEGKRKPSGNEVHVKIGEPDLPSVSGPQTMVIPGEAWAAQSKSCLSDKLTWDVYGGHHHGLGKKELGQLFEDLMSHYELSTTVDVSTSRQQAELLIEIMQDTLKGHIYSKEGDFDDLDDSPYSCVYDVSEDVVWVRSSTMIKLIDDEMSVNSQSVISDMSSEFQDMGVAKSSSKSKSINGQKKRRYPIASEYFIDGDKDVKWGSGQSDNDDSNDSDEDNFDSDKHDFKFEKDGVNTSYDPDDVEKEVNSLLNNSPDVNVDDDLRKEILSFHESHEKSTVASCLSHLQMKGVDVGDVEDFKIAFEQVVSND